MFVGFVLGFELVLLEFGCGFDEFWLDGLR